MEEIWVSLKWEIAKDKVCPSKHIKLDVVLEPTVLTHVVSQLLGIRLEEERSNIGGAFNPLEKGIDILQSLVANDAFVVADRQR
jgi:hypothetical protein